MKKLLLSAAFILALSGYAAAQSNSASTVKRTSQKTPAKGNTTKTNVNKTGEKKVSEGSYAAKKAEVVIDVPKETEVHAGEAPHVPQ